MTSLMTSLALALLTVAPGPPVEVRTLDQQTHVGNIARLDASEVTVDTADGSVTIPAQKLLAVAPTQAPAAPADQPGVWVELVDGSTLLARQYAAKDGRATITLVGGEVVEADGSGVNRVRLQAADEARMAEWERIGGLEFDGDVLVVRKDEAINYLQGLLGAVSDTTVEFKLDDEMVAVKREKVFGLIYRHPAGRELPQAVCRITDAGGSEWSVQTVSLGEGQRLQWTTVGGLALDRPLGQIARIDFSAGKIVLLTDLKPQSVEWTPFFGTDKPLPAISAFYAPRPNQSFSGQPLRLGKQSYDNGLCLHSRTEIVYRLPGQYSRFEAAAGIDDNVRPLGNVRLVIRGDDRVLFDDTLTGQDDPRRLELDLTGVRRLSILVDFGEQLSVGDHLDLCDARIIK